MKTGLRYGRSLLLAAAFLAGCSAEKADAPPERPAVLITTAKVEARPVEELEQSLGRLESDVDPRVAAEVSGRVLAIAAQAGQTVSQGEVLARLDAADYRLAVERAGADLNRLEVLAEQQQRQVDRYRTLVKENFFSVNAMDEVETQLAATRAQMIAAQSGLAQARNNLDRTLVRAPAAGVIAQRLVSVGDYIGAGSPLFELNTDQSLRVVLPFPEVLGSRLAVGQMLRLAAPAAPEVRLETPITEIRPVIGSQNRAIEVLAEVRNPGGWRAGGSINGEVVLKRREGALVIPPLALVRRPAGAVVYVVTGEEAKERAVEIGVRAADFIEVVKGLEVGETVAVEGSAYLSDGAKVRQAQEQGT